MTHDAPLAFDGGVYIADTSVWARTGKDRPFQDEWETALLNNQIVTCGVTLMEMLWSAQNHGEFLAIEDEFSGLQMLPVGPYEFAKAIAALRQLAAVQSYNHRVPLPDALVAATAHNAGVGVLHYDRHFDKLRTVLYFNSRWVAPAGSMA